MPPPRVSPDTPMSCTYEWVNTDRGLQSWALTRPPITTKLSFSSVSYTLSQILPGPIAASFLSGDNTIESILSRAIVIPPSMLDAPAKAACPPLLAANGHCFNRDMRTIVETWSALVGLKMQNGLTWPCWPDQYAPVKASYAELPSRSTLLFPNRNLRLLHCEWH
jgi:hypothetical protein